MKERSIPIKEAAERCGVSRRTLKSWIRQMGYNLPPRQGKGRYTILVYEWMVEKLQAERSPRIARISGIGERVSSRSPRPKAPVPEGQQMTGDQTKA
jgi:predicted site-specific integrase-resolvase